MTTETILQDADRALTEAQGDDPKLRLAAITRFMRAFYDIAQQISAGNGSWDGVRSWARDIADRVAAARPALGAWQRQMGDLFYDPSRDEVDAEAALECRSQHAFAREAFRDTPVDAMLAGYEDAEVDQEFHDEAVRLALDAEQFVPASHTWWRNRPA